MGNTKVTLIMPFSNQKNMSQERQIIVNQQVQSGLEQHICLRFDDWNIFGWCFSAFTFLNFVLAALQEVWLLTLLQMWTTITIITTTITITTMITIITTKMWTRTKLWAWILKEAFGKFFKWELFVPKMLLFWLLRFWHYI